MLFDSSAIRTSRERKTGDASPSVIAVAKPGQIDKLRLTDRRHVSHASARCRSNSSRSSPSSVPKANRSYTSAAKPSQDILDQPEPSWQRVQTDWKLR